MSARNPPGAVLILVVARPWLGFIALGLGLRVRVRVRVRLGLGLGLVHVRVRVTVGRELLEASTAVDAAFPGLAAGLPGEVADGRSGAL